MAKVSRKSSSKKNFLILTGIVITAILIVTALEISQVINLFGSADKNTKSNGPSAEEIAKEKDTNANSKQTYLDNSYGKDGNNSKNDSSSSSSGASNNGNAASISSLIASKNDGSVVLIAKMQSVPSGTCKLTINNAGKVVQKSADVIYQPEFSSCAGFSVPVGDIGAGSWKITLVVTTPQGTELDKQITYEVN